MVGVESVTIDSDKGLVTVSGDIDPVVLLQKVKRMGKEAKLWFFEQEPDCNDKPVECSDGASKIECGGTESGSNNEDDRHFDWHSQHKCETDTMGGKEHGWGFQSLPAMSSNVHSRLYPPSLPSAMSSNVHAYSYSRSLPRLGYRPTQPYQQSVPGHRLTPHGYYLQPHPSRAYRYFRSQSPPRANAMVHYTDYADNYSL